MLYGAIALCLAPFAVGHVAASFDTASNNPGDPDFYLPNYPVAFVRAPIVEEITPHCQKANGSCSECEGCSCDGTIVDGRKGKYHIGTDVLSANDPDPGNELWMYLPANGAVKQLFPLPVHLSEIDAAIGVGSVIEPSASEDGTRIYFSYFHDATPANSTGNSSAPLPWSGADIYVIDVSALLADPSVDPATLPLQRLTTREYQGTTMKQDEADRDKDAMNPTLASSTDYGDTRYGTVYMHPTEVRTRTGLKLVYVSNKRRLGNSNSVFNVVNNNFNLHMADLKADGTLHKIENQFQYYTTTSALSPSPLREGLAFSYQATTEDRRLWHIQGMDSEGRWYPLLGYGHGPELFHLQSFCVADEGGGAFKDYVVAAKYYNDQNEGYGSLWKQDLEIIGINTYDNASGGTKSPQQHGSIELTPVGPECSQTLAADYPSCQRADGSYYGKFTAPRCGGVDELFFSYTPTSANARIYDGECHRNLYSAHIGFRPDLEPFTPGETVANGGAYKVVVDTTGGFNLSWPTPMVPWSTRSNGDSQQQFSADPIIDHAAPILEGEPFAQVGTSALYNTDIKPFECVKVAGDIYSPWTSSSDGDKTFKNRDLWTKVTYDQGTLDCAKPDPSEILGIAVHTTSNEPNLGFHGGYNSGEHKREVPRLLGVHDVRGQQDQSFKALIPSNVPFDFHLLDSEYGMRLADVRSWHSLKPRESRTDCGGCHQHDLLESPVDFGGTYADQNPPVDMVRATPTVAYDAFCNPTLATVSAPTEAMPEWRADIVAGLQDNCAGCHSTLTGDQSGVDALSWGVLDASEEKAVYDAIVALQYADARLGALGSQLFWAAAGSRTDGRPNSDYNPADHDNCEAGGETDGCTYYHTDAHAVLADNCVNGDQAYADWMLKLGKWIDHGLIRNKDRPYDADFDRFHPTADAALVTPTCDPTRIRVGWWDDSDKVKEVTVLKRANENAPLYQQLWTSPANPIPNGSAVFNVSNIGNAWITIRVVDHADNRQVYRKRVSQLVGECVPTSQDIGQTASP
ncbi:hypothetical protein ABI59_09815 [Acidobacteria bacterium Mor1]|nr:hypothetical protein ABI59_09815 [Acidobacteria bacterium Mor1]